MCFLDISRLVEILREDKSAYYFTVATEHLDTLNEKNGTNIRYKELELIFTRIVLVKLLSDVKTELSSRLVKLEAIVRKKIEKIEPNKKNGDEEYDPKKIFVVHGRDDTAKNDLKEMLEKELKLEPIILSEQEDEGKTVIEKFENKTLNIGYAFILLTPDDLGGLKEQIEKNISKPTQLKKSLKDRARENVILELGYFVGKLSRRRVCCLEKKSAHVIPSDLHGLITKRYSSSVRELFLDIKKELEKAGYC